MGSWLRSDCFNFLRVKTKQTSPGRNTFKTRNWSRSERTFVVLHLFNKLFVIDVFGLKEWQLMGKWVLPIVSPQSNFGAMNVRSGTWSNAAMTNAISAGGLPKVGSGSYFSLGCASVSLWSIVLLLMALDVLPALSFNIWGEPALF